MSEEYHYDYGGQSSGDKRKNGHRGGKGDWGGWALIVLLFALGIWPVALFLLFSKIFGNDAKKKQTAPPPLRTAEDAMRQTERAGGEADGQSGRAKSAAKNVVKSPAVKKSNARAMKILGLALAAIGVICAVEPADMVLAGYVQYWVWEMLQYLALAVGGVGMFFGGLKMDANLRRYARYLAVMGQSEAVSLSELSRKLGWKTRQAEKDLQKMIDKGYFGSNAYIDLELGYFFRSRQANEDLRSRNEAKNKAETEQPPKEAESGYSGILRNIRRANDRIADPELTAKIDRLESITARIFKAVEEDPKKRSRIDTFLNYYLPTTQKLLDAYAEFDAAGVEGDNLRQAKTRIEKTMDAIVEGFEHQLDELYKGDVLDVDSDIRVMESMLKRDTASVEKDFGLGGGAKTPAGDIDLGGMAAQEQQD